MPIQVSASELSKREFVLCYDVCRDQYTRPNDIITGGDGPPAGGDWASLVHTASANVQRNVEADHQQAYLCRQVGKAQGEVCWRVEHLGQTVRSVEALLSGCRTFHPDAGFKASLQCGQKNAPFRVESSGAHTEPDDDVLHLKLHNQGQADWTELRVALSGGTGTYNEWQHAQLFRTPTREPNAQNLLLKIQFEEAGLVKVRPTIPCRIEFQQENFVKGFLPKRRIQIIGTPLAKVGGGHTRIVVNLVEAGEQACRDANVPFHFNPRFADKQVVRNNWNKQRGGWQAEERDGDFPFELGRQFVLELIAEDVNKIHCLVDNKHFCDFETRDQNLTNVTRLEIAGDVELAAVTLLATPGVLLQPLGEGPQLVKFADHNLKPGFLSPRRIQILATGLNKGRQRVAVNLCSDGEVYKECIILLHFNIRFGDKVVVRNSWHKEKGGWGPEERGSDGGGGGVFPFELGRQFALDLVAEPGNKIKCIVDEKPFCEFTARDDLSLVSQLLIDDDAVEVKSISIQG